MVSQWYDICAGEAKCILTQIKPIKNKLKYKMFGFMVSRTREEDTEAMDKPVRVDQYRNRRNLSILLGMNVKVFSTSKLFNELLKKAVRWNYY